MFIQGQSLVRAGRLAALLGTLLVLTGPQTWAVTTTNWYTNAATPCGTPSGSGCWQPPEPDNTTSTYHGYTGIIDLGIADPDDGAKTPDPNPLYFETAAASAYNGFWKTSDPTVSSSTNVDHQPYTSCSQGAPCLLEDIYFSPGPDAAVTSFGNTIIVFEEQTNGQNQGPFIEQECCSLVDDVDNNDKNKCPDVNYLVNIFFDGTDGEGNPYSSIYTLSFGFGANESQEDPGLVDVEQISVSLDNPDCITNTNCGLTSNYETWYLSSPTGINGTACGKGWSVKTDTFPSPTWTATDAVSGGECAPKFFATQWKTDAYIERAYLPGTNNVARVFGGFGQSGAEGQFTVDLGYDFLAAWGNPADIPRQSAGGPAMKVCVRASRAANGAEVLTLSEGFSANPPTDTPEPSSIALAAIGLAGIAIPGWRRRRRAARSS